MKLNCKHHFLNLKNHLHSNCQQATVTPTFQYIGNDRHHKLPSHCLISTIVMCQREGRLRYAATTANVTSYANYSAEVPPKSKKLLILQFRQKQQHSSGVLTQSEPDRMTACAQVVTIYATIPKHAQLPGTPQLVHSIYQHKIYLGDLTTGQWIFK